MEASAAVWRGVDHQYQNYSIDGGVTAGFR
jgi:hypothetical protein